MTIVRAIRDGLQSFATRLGTGQDKAVTASYALNMLDDQQLEAAFRTSWVCRKIVMVPSLDATRRWRQWTGDDAKKVEELEDNQRIRLRAKVQEAHWQARLFGGAAILIGTPDADFAEPLDPSSIGLGGLRYLAVLSRQDLTGGIVEDDPRQALFGKPRYYEVQTAARGLFRVHPSRLVVFEGERLPRWNTGGGYVYGWGDSVLQSTYEAARNLDSTMANVASLVFDAKTDIVKIQGLSQNISDPAYEEALVRRFGTARLIKGNHGTLILDAEEEYESKSYTFSGLDKIADRFMQVAAGAADIPMTRLLGASPGGLNSSGEGDLANYYDRVASIQTLEIEPALTTLDEVLMRSALGGIPDRLTYEWRPLRQMTELQRSELRHRDAQTVKELAASLVYSDEAVAAVGAQMFQETGIDALAHEAPEGEE